MLVTMISGKRNADYLQTALDSVTPQAQPDFPFRLFRDENGIGSRRMMRRAFDYFVNETDEQRLLYLEDDIVICKNFIEYASMVQLRERWAILSFHDARMRVCGPPGAIALPTCKFLYTQAFVVCREVASRLLGEDFETPPHKTTDGNGSDRKLAQLMRRLGFIQYGLQLPSLVFHIGYISAVTGVVSPARGNPTFPGVDFDAMTLLRRKSGVRGQESE